MALPDSGYAYGMIRAAILTKTNIAFVYNGRYREMSPHVLGLKNGRPNSLMYQFNGDSSKGLKPDGSPENWRCISVAGVIDIRFVSGDWHTGPNHSRPQTCVDEIDVEVDLE